MKTIILFSILFFPLSLFAKFYPIEITNSGKTNNLIIIPTVTAYPCFSAGEGLSISGAVETIPPNTTRTYMFSLPSNLLLECAYIIKGGTGFNGGELRVQNEYTIGTTLTNTTYHPIYSINIQYQSTDSGETYAIYPPGGMAIPPYMIFTPDNHSVSINADEIPQN